MLFTQSINFSKFYCQRVYMFEKCDSWNRQEWMVASFSTKIENATLIYKTALSEANAKANRMTNTKWTYHKERSFTSNCFFWKFCFTLRTSYKELIWYFLLSHMFPLQGSSRKGNSAEYTPLLLKRNTCQTWLCLVIIYKFLSGG